MPSGYTLRPRLQATRSDYTFRLHAQTTPSGYTLRLRLQAACSDYTFRLHAQTTPSGYTLRPRLQATRSDYMFKLQAQTTNPRLYVPCYSYYFNCDMQSQPQNCHVPEITQVLHCKSETRYLGR